MLEEWIEGISIRGRMAYSLICLETACCKWQIESTEMSATLSKFWEFTISMSLDVWDVEAQRTQPYLYAFYDEFQEAKEWRGMAEEWGFDTLPDSQQEALGRMLVLLHGPAGNLFAGFDSYVTADPLIELINIMLTAGLDLPDRSRVTLSRVEESGGWGIPHPREYFM